MSQKLHVGRFRLHRQVTCNRCSCSKENFRSGTYRLDLAHRTGLTISKEEMEDIMKIVKSVEESG